MAAGTLLGRAVDLHQKGALDQALSLYRRVLAVDPAQPDALHLLGMVRRRQGALAEGVAMMARALVCDPSLSAAHFNLSAALQEQGRLDQAARHLRRQLVCDPERGQGLGRLGVDRLARGHLEEAQSLLRRALQITPDDTRLRLAAERCAIAQAIRADADDPSLPPGLVVRGVFRDSSGYAYKVRQFVRHLVEAGVRVRLVDLNYGPNDDLSDDQLDPLFRSLDRPVRAKAVLSFTTPPMVERIPGLKTINYSVFEGVRIPPLWAAHSHRHDHVVVATASSRDAWLQAGHPPERIHLCPEGVAAVPATSVVPSEIVDAAGRRLSDYPIRLLNVSDLNGRKNLTGLLRVWMRATRPDDPAALLLKIGKGSGIARDFRALLAEVMRDTGLRLDGAAPVFLVEGKLSDAAMLRLYAAATHYWSMSHGEGWDLAAAQAGAMGCTVLAPRHSAYCAYLSDDTAHLIPSTIAPAFGDYAGMDWWTPDEDAAAALLRAVIVDPLGTRRSAQQHLLDHVSWSKATERLMVLLAEHGAL